jgi:molybdenum cofactor cytidylyltransferase
VQATTPERRTGVLLAGGAGTRFLGPTHKLLATFRGRRIIDWGVDAVRAAGLEPWVVWGALAEVSPPLGDDIVTLRNERWGEGMATSLQVAIGHARALGLDAITVGPADQPLVPAEAWRAVAATQAPIAVATYGGRRGNPVRLGAEIWDLLPLTGDVGARDLMRVQPDLVTEVACQGNPADIDTLEDLNRWNSSTTSP